MLRIHVPNLFAIAGEPGNGKTTLADAFARSLGCPVVHTDKVFLRWVADNLPQQLRSARASIRRHYPKMTPEQQRAWHEHLESHLAAIVAHAPVDAVVEGWLLQHTPADLQARRSVTFGVAPVTMRRYKAHAWDAVFKPKKKGDEDVVHGLAGLLKAKQGAQLLHALAASGRDDYAQFASPGLATRILNLSCDVDAFFAACVTHGGEVVHVDTNCECVRNACRNYNAVQRRRDVSFLCGDVLDYAGGPFDCVRAVGPVDETLSEKIKSLLSPAGVVVSDATPVGFTHLRSLPGGESVASPCEIHPADADSADRVDQPTLAPA